MPTRRLITLPAVPSSSLLNVDGRGEFLAVDGEDAVAHRDIQAGLRQRGFLARIEDAAGVDLLQAIAIVFDLVVRAEQAAGNFLGFGNCAAIAAQVARPKMRRASPGRCN